MRRIVLFLVAVMALSTTAWCLSQDAMVDLYTKRLISELTLSDQQTQEVRAILNTQIGKLRAIALDKDTRPREKMQDIRTLTEKTTSEISGKLDDQQKQKLNDLAAPLLPQFRLLQLDDRLNLSAEQVTQIDEILAANSMQRLPQGERGSSNREDFRKQMQENREKMDTAIENVLTDEQKEIYAKMRQEQQEQMQQMRGGRKRF